MNDSISKHKISVIIISFNIEKYISQCLDSVILQKKINLEIIVVDDGSTDNTQEIIKQYADKDSRIKVVFNNENLGVSESRNIGIQKATGDYIHFVDGDDMVVNNCYEVLCNKLLQHQGEVDTIMFAYSRFKENKIIDRPFSNKISNQTFSSVAEKKFLIKNKPGVTVWNKLYKRSFLISSNLNFAKGLIYEDILWFWQTILSAKSILVLNQCLYKYRIRQDSIMNGVNNKKLLNVISVNNRVFDYVEQANLINEYGDVFFTKFLKTYIRFLRRIDCQYKKDFFESMQKSLNYIYPTVKRIALLNKISKKLLYKIYFLKSCSFNRFTYFLIKLFRL